MKPLLPPDDLPEGVDPVKFHPPEGMEDKIESIVGVSFKDEEGEVTGMQFMFELSKEEINVLKHDPFLTLTIMADHLHPFSLQTSQPPSDKYQNLSEHTHLCTTLLSHEEQVWWRCDNPQHEKEDQARMCDGCWEIYHDSLISAGDKDGDTDSIQSQG